LAKGLHQILAAAAALDAFSCATKDRFNLLVELIAIGYDDHS
jgi:hypothetical protein